MKPAIREWIASVAALCGLCITGQGQTGLASRSEGTRDRGPALIQPRAHHQAVSPISITMPPSSVFRLTGILVLPPHRKAFIEVHSPGQEPRYFTLSEGQQQGDLELFAIDSKVGKIALRHQNSIVELSMSHQPRKDEAVRLAENQRDSSHIAAHVMRARMDRERDERERREAKAAAANQSAQP
jgi:hypothetical protein